MMPGTILIRFGHHFPITNDYDGTIPTYRKNFIPSIRHFRMIFDEF